MDKRYIATISETPDEGQMRTLVIDQKQFKIIHDSVSAKDLVEGIKKLLLTQYGDEIMFIEKKTEGAPQPNQVE
ncbi:MAG TPA: hypothetical protein VK154_11450 [Chitinophagales bacterium]|nr:hypothetical protein [Chitinophagales bacterium]